MKRTDPVVYAIAFGVVSVAAMLLGCGGTDSGTSSSCDQCDPTPKCCSTSGGIQVGGVIVPDCCPSCPANSTPAGIDKVTPGGPYIQCSCDKC